MHHISPVRSPPYSSLHTHTLITPHTHTLITTHTRATSPVCPRREEGGRAAVRGFLRGQGLGHTTAAGLTQQFIFVSADPLWAHRHSGSGAAVTGLNDDGAAESQPELISAPTEKTQIAQILKVQTKQTLKDALFTCGGPCHLSVWDLYIPLRTAGFIHWRIK